MYGRPDLSCLGGPVILSPEVAADYEQLQRGGNPWQEVFWQRWLALVVRTFRKLIRRLPALRRKTAPVPSPAPSESYTAGLTLGERIYWPTGGRRGQVIDPWFACHDHADDDDE